MSYYFAIIGTRDNPLYELEFGSFKQTNTAPGKLQFPPNVKEILPFISNSSLDLVEDAQWSTNQFYLGKIDSFYGLLITAFITQGNIKFILCYEMGQSGQKSDDNAIKQFFIDANELYVKCLLNPFYAVNDAIISPDFDMRIKLLAKKHFYT